MKARLSLLMVLAVCLGGATAATAAPITYTASLSGDIESPPNSSTGTGFTTVIYDDLLHTLDVAVDFTDLTGVTTVSHIHCCTTVPFTGTAGVATETPTFEGFPVGVKAASYTQLFDLTDCVRSWNPAFISGHGGTTASAEAAFAAGLAGGQAYLNIHSSFAPSGGIPRLPDACCCSGAFDAHARLVRRCRSRPSPALLSFSRAAPPWVPPVLRRSEIPITVRRSCHRRASRRE